MFSVFTEDRQIVTVGPDTRIYLDSEDEERRVNVFAGPWLLAHFQVSDDVGAPLGGWDLAHELVQALFAAMLDGKRGFDVSAFLDTPDER